METTYINETDQFNNNMYLLHFQHGTYAVNAVNTQDSLETFADWCIDNATGYLFTDIELSEGLQNEDFESFYGSYGNCLNELPVKIEKKEIPEYKVLFSLYLWDDEAIEIGEQISIETWEETLTLTEIISKIADEQLIIDGSVPECNFSQDSIQWDHSTGYETGTVLNMHISQDVFEKIKDEI